MTFGHYYLLGAAAMGLRTLWATRPTRLPSGELERPTVLIIDDEECDLRYMIATLFALSWPVLVVLYVAIQLDLFVRGEREKP